MRAEIVNEVSPEVMKYICSLNNKLGKIQEIIEIVRERNPKGTSDAMEAVSAFDRIEKIIKG